MNLTTKDTKNTKLQSSSLFFVLFVPFVVKSVFQRIQEKK